MWLTSDSRNFGFVASYPILDMTATIVIFSVWIVRCGRRSRSALAMRRLSTEASTNPAPRTSPDPESPSSPQPKSGPAARVKRIRARVQIRVERERRYVVALGATIADRSRETAASMLAGALAFRFFLTLLPLTFVLVVGLGYLKSVLYVVGRLMVAAPLLNAALHLHAEPRCKAARDRGDGRTRRPSFRVP